MDQVEIAAVHALVQRALALSNMADREAFLKTETAGRDDLRRHALIALRSHDLTTGFLETGGGIHFEGPTLTEGSQVGPWKIGPVLGQGGMGEVYEVSRSDGHFEKTAALKVLSTVSGDGGARFARERQILADLEHPSIARLLDGGVLPDARPFLVMERIQGVTADSLALDGKSTAERLSLFIQLCNALEYAHGRLVLHGDIKPANVLLTETDELKLVDFGVAGLLSEVQSTERAPMTLAYAAPEQIAGEPSSVRTEIYSLGLTLTEWLTGHGPTSPEASTAGQHLPADLRAIIGKATASSPDARYTSVADFRSDIERYLTLRPVLARPAGFGHNALLFFCRYPVSNVLGLAFLVSLIAGLVGVSLYAYQAERAAHREALARIEAETQASLAIEARNLLISLTVDALDAEDGGGGDIAALLADTRSAALQTFDTDPAGARMTLYTLSTIHDGRGDLAQVIETLAPIYQRPDTDDVATIQSLITYGLYTMDTEYHDQASDALERAIAIMDRHNQPEFFRADRAIAEAYLSMMGTDNPRKLAAVAELDRLAQELSAGDNLEQNEAVAHWDDAAFLAIQAGDADLAIELGEKSLALNRSIEGPKNLTDEEIAFVLVGSYANQGRVEEAIKLNSELVVEAERLYGPSVALANRLLMDGMLKSRSGQSAAALISFERAEPMYAEYDRSPSELRFSVLTNIAREQVILSDDANAMTAFDGLADDYGQYFEPHPRFGYFFYKRRAEAKEHLQQTDAALTDYETALDYAQRGGREDYVNNVRKAIAELSAVD